MHTVTKTVDKNCGFMMPLFDIPYNKDNWPFVSEHILTHGSLHYASTPTLTGMDTTAITVTPAGGTSTFRPQMPASHYHQHLQVSTLKNFFPVSTVANGNLANNFKNQKILIRQGIIEAVQNNCGVLFENIRYAFLAPILPRFLEEGESKEGSYHFNETLSIW